MRLPNQSFLISVLILVDVLGNLRYLRLRSASSVSVISHFRPCSCSLSEMPLNPLCSPASSVHPHKTAMRSSLDALNWQFYGTADSVSELYFIFLACYDFLSSQDRTNTSFSHVRPNTRQVGCRWFTSILLDLLLLLLSRMKT